MALLNSLERKFGRFAFPGLVQTIAVFWVLTFILEVLNPSMVELMMLDMRKVFEGQVWRLFSHILIAPTTSPIFLFFAVYFTFFLGRLLEEAWGAFRVNAFVFSGLLLIVITTLVVHFGSDQLYPFVAYKRTFIGHVSLYFGHVSGLALSGSILLACACIYPRLEIRLMALIPVKMMWIGLIDGGLLFLVFMRDYWSAFGVAIGLLPFLIVFLPILIHYLKNRANAAARLQKFKEDSRSEEASLHHCAICHKTEHEDHDLDFRVSGGEEYCVPCLEEKKKAAAEAG